MSANLITGNLFKPIYAYQDADYQAGISGNVTSIMPVGSQMALSIEDTNTIKADDGVLITKEGRRIQIDAGAIEEWSIPTGTQGQTNYYIVGFRLYTGDNSAELCETFVEKMENATDTIPEDTFRGGATEVHVSLGRVVQNGINLESVTSFLPVAQSFEDVRNAIAQLNSDLGQLNIDTLRIGVVSGTVPCDSPDNNTIGYKTTGAKAISISSLSGFPSGDGIVIEGYSIEMAYVSKVAENCCALLTIGSDGKIYANAAISGNVSFRIRIFYVDRS